ncbi:hypothetical protein NVP1101O_165 [Vibrio phage 1.101.O._10N.261.45.C6]|nr:hypothetical protein NVP1101O_165 [Vibrio phage 1.101.O._10N.261.45.C6]
MKKDQDYSPKYWVVHDKQTDDVFLNTAHKTKFMSERLFIETLVPMFPSLNYNDVEEMYLDNENYECILIELKIVDTNTDS